MDLKDKIEKLALRSMKPSRYIGGEVGSVVKDKSKVDVRFAFCFPDTYEVGMSHLGMKILYGLKNARENFWCERVLLRTRILKSLCARTISHCTLLKVSTL